MPGFLSFLTKHISYNILSYFSLAYLAKVLNMLPILGAFLPPHYHLFVNSFTLISCLLFCFLSLFNTLNTTVVQEKLLCVSCVWPSAQVQLWSLYCLHGTWKCAGIQLVWQFSPLWWVQHMASGHSLVLPEHFSLLRGYLWLHLSPLSIVANLIPCQ